MMVQASRRLRVLGLAKTSVGGTWAMRQARELVRLGVEVHIALPPGGRRIAEYADAGVVVHQLQPDLPARAPWRFPGALRQLRELVAAVEPDIIHSYYVGTTLAMRLALGKGHPIPRVFQVPGPLHLEHPLSRRSELATAGPRDYWIGTCSSIRDAYRLAGVPEERLFVSDYGVDTRRYAAGGRHHLRRELGLDDATPLVGMVALMYPPKRYLGQRRGLKGHEDLIDALALCLTERPDLRGVFIGGAWGGGAWYERQVREYARRRCGERAIFLGTRHDVPELLGGLDVAVQPSHSEGVAATLVEAQLLGVPTVATSVGGQPDLIVPDESGWLVPPRDPAALAGAILQALRDPARTRAIALRGQERARRLFDADTQAREVFAIYHTMLARRPAAAPQPRLST